jgi:hypothetical protein
VGPFHEWPLKCDYRRKSWTLLSVNEQREQWPEVSRSWSYSQIARKFLIATSFLYSKIVIGKQLACTVKRSVTVITNSYLSILTRVETTQGISYTLTNKATENCVQASQCCATLSSLFWRMFLMNVSAVPFGICVPQKRTDSSQLHPLCLQWHKQRNTSFRFAFVLLEIMKTKAKKLKREHLWFLL